MSKKLTPWFPMSVKPTRPGCYLIRGKNVDRLPFPFHYFNGTEWERDAGDVPIVSRGHLAAPIEYAGGWRGLAKKP